VDEQFSHRGGKRRIAVLVAALAALSVGVSVGLAKTSGPSQLSSQVYLRDNGLCPGPGDKLKKQGGQVTIVNEKGDWRISVHMRGAKPGKYHVDLRDANCNQFATAVGGSFKVKSDGSGDETVSYSASGFQSFFLRVHDNDHSISYYTPLLKISGNPS
jgi:hypothetical protein